MKGKKREPKKKEQEKTKQKKEEQKKGMGFIIAAVICTISILTACTNRFDETLPVSGLSDLAQPIEESSSQINTEAKELEIPTQIESQGNNAESQNNNTESKELKTESQENDAKSGGTETKLQENHIGSIGTEAGLLEENSGRIEITISAAGDVTLGNHKEQGYEYSFRQTYDQAEEKSYFFENVVDVFSQDDMTIVNLEGPLTLYDQAREGQIYSIKGDPEYVKLLTLGNIEAVSMGNNHRLDYGEEGSKDTVEALEQEGIVYAYDSNIGIYETETQGIRIGFVSVNEVSRGAEVEKDLQAGIAQLKEEGVDLIFACCHWGIERDYYPEKYQTSLGRKCIDWGADLVIGHHPHVLQGIDCYQGKYIIYSLGNFCFGANRNPSDKDTMIFQQTFVFENGEKQQGEAKVIPCSISSVTSRNDFKPTIAEGEEAKRIIERIKEYSKDYNVIIGEDGNITAKQ